MRSVGRRLLYELRNVSRRRFYQVLRSDTEGQLAWNVKRIVEQKWRTPAQWSRFKHRSCRWGRHVLKEATSVV